MELLKQKAKEKSILGYLLVPSNLWITIFIHTMHIWLVKCKAIFSRVPPASFFPHLLLLLVWTPCLMHRCVCIWWYILQNYNYKLHFQNLSIYHIPHVSIGTLAAENLDVCTACEPWDSNIQLTMVKDRRPGLGMPFLDSDTCARGCYLFLPGFSSLHDAIHGWMMGQMDGWKNLHDHDVLYYM
jgi:hypothetical protein